MTKNKVLEPALRWRIEGPFDSTYSLALLNREIARALSARGVDVVLHSTEGGGDFAASETFLAGNPDIQKMHARSREMSQATVDVTSRNLYPPRVADMRSPINLLHSYAWEESSFPANWVNDFNTHLSGLTCLSEHVLKAMQDNGVRIPMAVSGCGVDHWERVVASDDDRLAGTGAKAFRLLHVSSFFPRKGPDALLDSYGRAFSIHDDVTLVIKTFPNPHNQVHEQLARCRDDNPAYPHVVLIEDDLTDSDLKALYGRCHVLVGPSCAEGFALPLAEAMLSGLPVITTAWSGQLDFCSPTNSWLVDYKFEQADTHFHLLPSAWAAIDRDALASAMRAARDTPEPLRKAMAAQGREVLLRDFTWDKVASRLINFYASLKARKTPAPPSVGWISTWNVKCGIATYSDHLLHGLEWRPTVLAARDIDVLAPDGVDCVRCWSIGDDDLSDLSNVIDEHGLDTLVIQFNFGFFHPEKLAAFVAQQKAIGRTILVDLHATIDPPHEPARSMANFAAALSRCDRLLVHSIADMNRMKAFCDIGKLVLFPHGILEVPEPSVKEGHAVPTIATYGFCLPHKGLPEVLEAVGLLKDQGKNVNLTMINSEYPVDFSHVLADQLRDTIRTRGLQDRVMFESRFLPDAESLALLQAADLVVFAYHPTSESASGAVRYGLACGRPTLVTNLPIFEELGQAVWRVQGHDPETLANRIWEVLAEIRADSEAEQQRSVRATNWRSQHKYSTLTLRLGSLIRSLQIQKQSAFWA